MRFDEVLPMIRAGEPVRRKAWVNARFLLLVPGSTILITADRPLGQAAPGWVGRHIKYAPHIDVMLHDGTLAPWSAPSAELLADDWERWEPEPLSPS